MKLIWVIWNWIQFLSCLAWTTVWITIAMVVLLLTWRPGLPLRMARYIWAPGVLFMAGGHLEVEYDDDLD